MNYYNIPINMFLDFFRFRRIFWWNFLLRLNILLFLRSIDDLRVLSDDSRAGPAGPGGRGSCRPAGCGRCGGGDCRSSSVLRRPQRLLLVVLLSARLPCHHSLLLLCLTSQSYSESLGPLRPPETP